MKRRNNWKIKNYTYDYNDLPFILVNYMQLIDVLQKYFKIIIHGLPQIIQSYKKVTIIISYLDINHKANNISYCLRNNQIIPSYLAEVLEIYSIEQLKSYIRSILDLDDDVEIEILITKLKTISLDTSILSQFIATKYLKGRLPLDLSRKLLKNLNNTEKLLAFNNILKNYDYYSNKNNYLRLSNLNLFLDNQFITGCNYTVKGRLSARKSADKAKKVYNNVGSLKLTNLNNIKCSQINKNGTFNVNVKLGLNKTFN